MYVTWNWVRKEKSAFRPGLGSENDKNSFLSGLGGGNDFGREEDRKRVFPDLGGGRLKKRV